MDISSKNCLWQAVREDLLEYIRRNKLKPGDKFLSTDEVSARFKVSNITSRRALRELAKMNVIECGKGKGIYVKETTACDEIFFMVEYDSGVANALGLFIFNEINNGIVKAAAESEIKVTAVDPAYVAMAAAVKKPLNVIAVHEELKNKEAEAYLRSENVNCVHCHALAPHEGQLSIMDPLKEGAMLMVEHFIAQGHRRIAFMMPAGDKRWFYPRFEGYYDTIVKHGLPFSVELVKETVRDQKGVSSAMDELLSLPQPPTALFATHDALAMMALNYCQEKKVRVPQDIAVGGYDNRPECAISTPPLSSIEPFWKRQGELAVQHLLAIAAGRKPRKTIIAPPPLLVVRESSRMERTWRQG